MASMQQSTLAVGAGKRPNVSFESRRLARDEIEHVHTLVESLAHHDFRFLRRCMVYASHPQADDAYFLAAMRQHPVLHVNLFL